MGRKRAQSGRQGLVWRFAVASLVAFVAIGIALSSYNSRRFVTREEQASRFRAQALAGDIVQEIPSTERSFLQPMTGRMYRRLAAFVNTQVLQAPVVRVIVWLRDGTVLFSDDPTIVGTRLPVDDQLRKVFSDGSLAGSVEDIKGSSDRSQRGLPPKLYATDVPGYLYPGQSSGPPVVVIEIYQDYAAIQAAASQLTRTVFVVIAIGLGALWIMLLPIIRRVSRRLARQNRELEDQAVRLHDSLEAEQRALAERRRLLDKVLSVGEGERTRMAAELHDGPIQRLATIGLALQRIDLRMERENPEAARTLLAGTADLLSAEIQDLRRIMSDLRPPALEERGLQEALRDHVDSVGREAGFACDLECDLYDEIDPEIETVLYRVAQEALTNVRKHAHASRAWLSLRTNNGTVALKVSDDGRGFDPEARVAAAGLDHFGLLAMRERVEAVGGTWNVQSTPGTGTMVTAELPRKEPRA